MTQKDKYPAWWPKNSIHNDDPVGMEAKPFEDIRAMDNEHIRDLLTDAWNGGGGNPVEDYNLLDLELPIGANINAAVVVAMQSLKIRFSTTGVIVGDVEYDAFKKFSWADIFEHAFCEDELDYCEGDGPLPELYELMISTAERMRASIEAWSE